MSEDEYVADPFTRRVFVRNNKNVNGIVTMTQMPVVNMFAIKRSQSVNINSDEQVLQNSFVSQSENRQNKSTSKKITNLLLKDASAQHSQSYPTPRMKNSFRVQKNYDDQKLMSQYFVEKKNLDYKEFSQSKKESKRSLKELQEKYDIFDVSPNVTSRVISQRSSYAEQMTNVDSRLKHKLSELNGPVQKNNSVKPKRRKIEAIQAKTTEPKMIHLIGYVENILKWDRILKATQIAVLYNVLGTFISVMNGIHTKEKFVFIRGNNGTILECSFFEIDRPLPKISKGEFVGCFGDIIGAQRFRLYNIEIMNESDCSGTQRAIFLSQRVAHELCSRKSIL